MNEKSQFNNGVLAGVFLVIFGVVNSIAFYKTGCHLLDTYEQKMSNKQDILAKKDFVFNFENEFDLVGYSPNKSAISLTNEYAHDGKRSLEVEFPAGVDVTGFSFEVFGKGCFDWSSKDVLTGYIFNNTDDTAKLTIKFKSGEKYPKREFEKQIQLAPLQETKIEINLEELKNKLDINKVSYVGFYMQDPRTTFILYFDGLKTANAG